MLIGCIIVYQWTPYSGGGVLAGLRRHDPARIPRYRTGIYKITPIQILQIAKIVFEKKIQKRISQQYYLQQLNLSPCEDMEIYGLQNCHLEAVIHMPKREVKALDHVYEPHAVGHGYLYMHRISLLGPIFTLF